MYTGEKFNSITHLIGAIMATIGFGALLAVAVQHQNIWMTLSFSIFGLSLMLLYTASTLYHSFYHPHLKKWFQKFDHVSIYILIAGTYTPYTLVTLRESNGPLLLIIVWSLALIGILTDVLLTRRREILQLSIYLLMGWLVVTVYDPLLAKIPLAGIMWLVAGGMLYMLGIIFYTLDHHKKLKHAHGIWHVFVLIASTCQFISIIGYVR